MPLQQHVLIAISIVVFITRSYSVLSMLGCKPAVRETATICPRHCKLTFDLLTLKVVTESRVSWATSVPILVFVDLSVLDLFRCMRQTSERQTSDAHHRLMPPPP